MIEHQKAHQNEEVVCVYAQAKTKSQARGADIIHSESQKKIHHRPKEHFGNNQAANHVLSKVVIPDSAKSSFEVKGKMQLTLKCRNCDKFHVCYDYNNAQKLSGPEKGARVRMLREHEIKCKK